MRFTQPYSPKKPGQLCTSFDSRESKEGVRGKEKEEGAGKGRRRGLGVVVLRLQGLGGLQPPRLWQPLPDGPRATSMLIQKLLLSVCRQHSCGGRRFACAATAAQPSSGDFLASPVLKFQQQIRIHWISESEKKNAGVAEQHLLLLTREYSQ